MTIAGVPVGIVYTSIGLSISPFVIRTTVKQALKYREWNSDDEIFPLAIFSLVIGLISVVIWPAGFPLIIVARYVEKEKKKLKLAQKLQEREAA